MAYVLVALVLASWAGGCSAILAATEDDPASGGAGGAATTCTVVDDCDTPADPCFEAACVDGQCAVQVIDGCATCTGPEDCPDGSYCDLVTTGACRAQNANGDGCANGQACLSGFCVDGFCCDAACDGLCMACNVDGAEGVCSPEPDGLDPADDCPGNACNGAAACQCGDGSLNGLEADVDCGADSGVLCGLCGDAASCNAGADCASGVCAGALCQAPQCGDGIVNGTDVCDGDGAGTPGETVTCDADCTDAICGDGVINATRGELCDGDGAGVGGVTATCDADCTPAVCGDGITNTLAGEACDGDGAGTGGMTDTCDFDCSFQLCGDGVVNTVAGEECDGTGGGIGGETSACDINCSLQLCGDGTINVSAGEICDGNGFGTGGETALCDLDCTPRVCGDGTPNATAGETCDDGNTSSYDGCASSCASPADHVVISEVVGSPAASSFVELYNPGPGSVDLSSYYLADYATYYLLTAGAGDPTSGDFRVQFPPGTTIGAGAFLVVSLEHASSFAGVYGQNPDLDFDALDGTVPTPTGMGLTGASVSGELVVLFQWDGAADLVSDVDYALLSGAAVPVDKSGVTVGASTYAADTSAVQQAAVAPPNASAGQSLHRCDTSERTETESGGNGISGHDETSEPFATTFALGTPSPGAAPPAGACP